MSDDLYAATKAAILKRMELAQAATQDIITTCTSALLLLELHGPHDGMAEADEKGDYCGYCSGLNKIGFSHPCINVKLVAAMFGVKSK